MFTRPLLESGRVSIFEPCSQYLLVKECFSNSDSVNRLCDSKYDENVFKRTSDDNKIGTSVEDRMFMDIRDKELVIGEDGKWVAPLPFRQPKLPLPNNYEIALRRALALDASLKKDPRKRDRFATFMTKPFDNDHAEEAPIMLLFGVYHSQKPNHIRGVFDSSATFQGISLNI